MRHSSSWPDRVAQTVKVRVDPLSRAFTIIPTIRESLHPLLAGNANASWIDEIVFLDHGGSTSVETKRRFVDYTRQIQQNGPAVELGETFELCNLVPDVMNKSSRRDVAEEGRSGEDRNTESRLPKCFTSDETERNHGWNASDKSKSDFPLLDEENRSRLRDEGNETNSEQPSIKRNQDSQRDSPKINNQLPQEDHYPLETIVKIETPNPLTRETQEEEEVAQCSSQQSTPRKQSAPHIQIIDYDYIRSFSIQTERAPHACPKCTSEGLLQERVDPFRSPVSSKKMISGRCQDGRPETARKYSAAEGKMRSSWRRIGASGLIGGARNRKRYGQKRNGSPLCRPLNSEVRKQATLRRHYYPEGGWGYVIVTCSALVHFLGIGLQLAAPGSWHLTAELKFHQPALHSAGKTRVLFFPFALLTRKDSLWRRRNASCLIGRCLIEPDIVYLNRKFLPSRLLPRFEIEDIER
ncbi:hypothetical protein WH47_08627 [Habropoda laboriosa]|uniref:Uncharacterized protein n=1 Tax=Habropoda laboriosa TaxID=597456 RepID=A0A0L7QP51_9HYME|nr:hypothetical protein WH47_08627 [Habropoda laboriosa]